MTSDCVIDGCGKPVADAGYACHPCTDRLAEALRWVADNADDTDTVIARQTRTGSGLGRGGAETPLPVNWSAVIDADAVRNTLTTWARVILDARGITLPAPPPPPTGPRCSAGIGCRHDSCNAIRYRTTPAADSTSRVAAFLADQLPWLRHRPYADEAFAELDYAAGVLRRSLDVGGTRRYLGPCMHDDCDADVYAAASASYATCQCGAVHDVADRWQWLLDELRDTLVTASTISTVIAQWSQASLPSATVRSWIRRGRLLAKGADAGRPTYRVGDALDLIAAQHDRAMSRSGPKALTVSHSDGTKR